MGALASGASGAPTVRAPTVRAARVGRVSAALHVDLIRRSATAQGAASSQCFAAPGACAYPDPAAHTAGPPRACAALPASGSITASRAGETIANLHVSGTITVTAPGVTIDDVCVIANGGGQLGSFGVRLEGGAAHTLIEHSTIAGADNSAKSIDQAITNTSGTVATATRDYVHNCGECVWGGPWTVINSYVIADGMRGTSDHFEDVYCSDSTLDLIHDTLLNPEYQTAVVFCDTHYGQGGPCDNHISIIDSLLAGGDYVLYPCGNASSVGTSTMWVNRNRFARCTTPPFHYNAGTGGTACRGSSGILVGSGADSHGYWPGGGYFGPFDAEAVYCPPLAGQSWAGNVWDDNGATVACR